MVQAACALPMGAAYEHAQQQSQDSTLADGKQRSGGSGRYLALLY